MLIVTQGKKKIVNFDNAYSLDGDVSAGGTYDIDVTYKDGTFDTLGSYKTEERCIDVMAHLAHAAGAVNVYIMPEE